MIGLLNPWCMPTAADGISAGPFPLPRDPTEKPLKGVCPPVGIFGQADCGSAFKPDKDAGISEIFLIDLVAET